MAVWTLAEFPNGHALLEAARALRQAGFDSLDAHSPYPLRGADEVLGLRRSPVPLIALIGGITGAATAYVTQYWTAAVHFPINVANRAPHSAPAFVPITFELTILFAALAIFFGLLALWRMPQPYHPVFELEQFRSASTHGFWVTVAHADPRRAEEAADRLRELGATHVSIIPEAS